MERPGRWCFEQPPGGEDLRREGGERPGGSQVSFPEFFACNVPRMASLSRRLRAERELSFYGDEETGLPPEELYSEDDAGEALAQAEWAWELCDRLTQTS